jgi:hypothetical protein
VEPSIGRKLSKGIVKLALLWHIFDDG